MKVQIYMGSFNTLEKSGIGRAILHQKEILEKQGITVSDKMDKDVQIVHINTVLLNSVFTAIKAKILGKKVVYYAHSTMEDFKNSFIGSNLIAPLFKQWIKFCYNLGDIIITPTNYSKEILDNYGLKRNILALTNGIDTDFFKNDYSNLSAFQNKYNINNGEKTIISVGHFIERKGILSFIEVARKMPDIKFIWFGHTNFNIIPEKIKSAIKSAPENLIFAGYVSKEELKLAYQSADLFAFMSYEETEGIVVLEALSCEIPIIVRDIPVYKDWLEDNYNSYKANSDDEFYDKINNVLNNYNNDIIKSGRNTALERNIYNTGKKLTYIHSYLQDNTSENLAILNIS